MNKLEKELIINNELNQYAYITITSTKDDVKLLRHHSYDISTSSELIDCIMIAEVEEGDRSIECETDLFIYYSYNSHNDTYSIKEVSITGGEILNTHDQNDLDRYLQLIEDSLEVDLSRS